MKPNSIKPGSPKAVGWCLSAAGGPQADPRRILNNNQLSIINNHFKALPRLCAYKLIMTNKPNFQKSRPAVTHDMIRTYNDNFPEKPKKNKPKTHQKRAKNERKRIKTSKNERKRAKFRTISPDFSSPLLTFFPTNFLTFILLISKLLLKSQNAYGFIPIIYEDYPITKTQQNSPGIEN